MLNVLLQQTIKQCNAQTWEKNQEPFFSILDENNLESAITGNIPVRLQQIENVIRNAGFTLEKGYDYTRPV